jgi:hypothetical protein
MGRPQEGQDVESSFFTIIIYISIYDGYIKKYLEIIIIILILFDLGKRALLLCFERFV